MEHYIFLIAHAGLIVGCISMAIVFLVLPLPSATGLQKYRNSLRFLSVAYLTLALIQSLDILFNLSTVNMISMETLTVASLQALLFTFSLITLINPSIITKHTLYSHMLPIIVFIILYSISTFIYGNPQLPTYKDLRLNALHPTVVIRELFMAFYALQLIYLVLLFKIQVRKYNVTIDNYFAEKKPSFLRWVQYCFYAALVIGICALLSCFMFTSQLILAFNIAYTIFYIVFGLYYIRYPGTFVYIEAAISPRPNSMEDQAKINKQLAWDELKMMIVENRYYLKEGANIEEMARTLKIGRTSLSSLINKNEKMNFNTWINTLRMEEAKRLIVEYPTFSLTQIAEMTGYSESSNFSRQFKQMVGQSPLVWRQEKNGKN